jgi:hypothetical protein
MTEGRWHGFRLTTWKLAMHLEYSRTSDFGGLGPSWGK